MRDGVKGAWWMETAAGTRRCLRTDIIIDPNLFGFTLFNYCRRSGGGPFNCGSRGLNGESRGGGRPSPALSPPTPPERDSRPLQGHRDATCCSCG